MIGIILHKQSGSNRYPSVTSFLRCATVALVSACTLASPLFLANTLPLERAYAATWPLSGSQASVSTAFHQTYSYGGKELLHSGLDVAAEPGSGVMAPVSGTVKFVGNVPAGDSYLSGRGAGETMQAVSVLLEDGRTLTLMPLEEIVVAEGEELSEGESVGRLAAAGDRSLRETHLHVGLKRGGTYYDPSELFPALAKVSKGPEPSSEGAAVAEAAGMNTTVAYPARAPEEAPASPSTSLNTPESIGTISSGAVSWVGEATREEPTMIDGAKALVLGVASACNSQITAVSSCLEGVSQTSGIPAFALTVLFFSVLTLLLAAVLRGMTVLLRKLLERALQERENRVLYQVFGGDTIQKLFPAPGTSFITRGRSAQRR